MKTPTPEKIVEFRLMMGETVAQAAWRAGSCPKRWREFESGKIPMLPRTWAMYCVGSTLLLEQALGCISGARVLLRDIPAAQLGILCASLKSDRSNRGAADRALDVIHIMMKEIINED